MGPVRLLKYATLSLDKIQILFGGVPRDISKISKKHSDLIESGFYVCFRSTLNDLYLNNRAEEAPANCTNNVFGICYKEVLLSIMQKLVLLTVHNNKFKQAIAHSKFHNTSIWYPLSYSYQKDLNKLNLVFSRHICHALHIALVLVIAFIKSSRFLKQNNSLIMPVGLTRKVIWLDGFSAINFPSPNNETFNLISWLCMKNEIPTTYFHDCAEMQETMNVGIHLVCYSKFPSSQDGLRQKFRNFRVATSTLRELGRMGYKTGIEKVLLLPDLMMCSSIIESKINFDEILCLSTRLAMKPLWCSSYESLGTKVWFLNYAIAAEPFLPSNPLTQDGIWQLNSWNNSLVIDERQIEEIRQLSHFPPDDFRITGAPFWGGKVVDLDFSTGQIISVFDTGIQANSKFSAGILDELGWNNFSLELEFILAILQAVEDFNVRVVHKRKRAVKDGNSVLRTQNLDYLRSAYGSSYQYVQEDVSADFLISKSRIVISKPISTTGVSAREQHVPSIYLDPTRNIKKEDPSLRGIPLVHTSSELHDLIKLML